MMTELTLSICLVLFMFFVFIHVFRKLFVQYTFMNKYKTYLELLKYYSEESFQVIYKDQIVGFSINGQTIQGDELETAKRNYTKLCFELMGPNNEAALIKFFGKRENLITNMLIYFQKKCDDDGIMKLLNEQELVKGENSNG